LAFAFTCMANLQIKFIPAIPSFQVLFSRNMQFAVYSFLYSKVNKVPLDEKIPTVSLKRLVMRSFIGSFGVFLHFVGIKYLPLSEAIVLYQMMPMLTGVLATIMLKEKFELRQLFCIIFSVVGVVLIVKPPFLFGSEVERDPTQIIGAIAMLSSALVDSFAFILIRQIAGKIPNQIMVYYVGLLGALMAGVGMIFLGVGDVFFGDFIHLFLVGALYYIVQLTRNRAFKFGEAGKLAILGATELVYAYLIDIFYFGIAPDKLSVVGSLTIMGCVISMMIRRK